ncbi:MAG TPA: hypothetical protein VGJ00_08540 [Rhabdochlamydiaceae bacterium]|jgi:tetratricopeptide (TPR) repeat protein
MLRYILPILVFLGSGFSCFSREIPRNVELFAGIVVSPAMAYASCGNVHLLLRDYEFALEDFHRAAICLEHFEEHCPLSEFMILFGKAIAYDNLNERDKCDQVLSSLILHVSDWEKIDFEDDDEEEEDDDEDSEEFYHDSIDLYKRIASLAPTQEVREILISFLDDEKKS